MQKIVLISLAAYIVGRVDKPVGLETLIFACMTFVCGFMVSLYCQRIKMRVRAFGGFSWGKYELRRKQEDKPKLEVVKDEPKRKAKAGCDLCEGETDIFIAGVKSKCPKCAKVNTG
jgi:hypothetical protein